MSGVERKIVWKQSEKLLMRYIYQEMHVQQLFSGFLFLNVESEGKPRQIHQAANQEPPAYFPRAGGQISELLYTRQSIEDQTTQRVIA